MRNPIVVTIAPGELIDKITILQIKREKIVDAAKQQHVLHELTQLEAARDREIPASGQLAELTKRLREVNLALWEVEDEIRRCERSKDFGQDFVQLARSVYRTNDQRAQYKRLINELLESDVREVKQYVDYDNNV
jgi:hypothetical protein